LSLSVDADVVASPGLSPSHSPGYTPPRRGSHPDALAAAEASDGGGSDVDQLRAALVAGLKQAKEDKKGQGVPTVPISSVLAALEGGEEEEEDDDDDDGDKGDKGAEVPAARSPSGRLTPPPLNPVADSLRLPSQRAIPSRGSALSALSEEDNEEEDEDDEEEEDAAAKKKKKPLALKDRLREKGMGSARAIGGPGGKEGSDAPPRPEKGVPSQGSAANKKDEAGSVPAGAAAGIVPDKAPPVIVSKAATRPAAAVADSDSDSAISDTVEHPPRSAVGAVATTTIAAADAADTRGVEPHPSVLLLHAQVAEEFPFISEREMALLKVRRCTLHRPLFDLYLGPI